jgi:hypothetical protein
VGFLFWAARGHAVPAPRAENSIIPHLNKNVKHFFAGKMHKFFPDILCTFFYQKRLTN